MNRLVLFDGDPFECSSHVTAVVAGGEELQSPQVTACGDCIWLSADFDDCKRDAHLRGAVSGAQRSRAAEGTVVARLGRVGGDGAYRSVHATLAAAWDVQRRNPRQRLCRLTPILLGREPPHPGCTCTSPSRRERRSSAAAEIQLMSTARSSAVTTRIITPLFSGVMRSL